MLSQTPKRFLSYLLLAASFALSAASASAQQQERKALPIEVEQPVIKSDCPRPIALTLTATNPTSFFAADLAQGQINAQHMTGLGDTSLDKNFLYTFQWKRDEKCCQITKAVLTVKMRSNGPGQSSTSPDAANDGIAIMHAGVVVAPYNEAVYSNVPKPFGTGTVAIKTWALNQTVLNNINTFGNLTFSEISPL